MEIKLAVFKGREIRRTPHNNETEMGAVYNKGAASSANTGTNDL